MPPERPAGFSDRFPRISLVGLLVAIVASCGDSTGPDYSRPGITDEGAVLRAEPRQSEFSGSDTAYVDIILENPRDTSITLPFASDCELHGYFIRPDGQPLFPGFFSCNPEKAHSVILAPGAADTLVLRLWSPLGFGNDFVPLEAGVYTIFGRTGPLGSGAPRTTESNRVRVRYIP